jgi:NAD(P)-dependent dehydrogenase (short-subunit alcohol dehydrogenase family)
MQKLKDKVALVTGSGAGIGESICLRFAREGVTVVGMDIDQSEAERVAAAVNSEGNRAYSQPGDVSKRADCARVVEWTSANAGNIDILCNVAGIVETGTVLEASEESWQRTMDVNLKGMFYLSQLVLPSMIHNGGGSIINISSVVAVKGAKSRCAYSVSKAGVIGLTRSLAVDFIDKGIRANAICPGVVESPSWHERVKQAPDPEKALKEFIERAPMGRVGQPEEVAALCAYLASDESAFVTGQILSIDGGATM